MNIALRISPLLLVLACSPQEQAPEAPSTEASASPNEAPEPSDAPARPAEETPSDAAFHPVVTWKMFRGEGVGILRVFGTRDGDVFIAAGPQVMKAARDGSVERKTQWLRGIRETEETDHEGAVYLAAWYVETIGGRWPDALFMTINPLAGGRMAYPIEVYRFANESWTFLPSVHRDVVRSHPRALAQWKEDSVVSLRGFTSVAEPEDEMGLSKADERAFKAALATMNPLAVVRGAPKAPKLGSDLAAFDALPTGELVAVSADARSVIHLATDGTTSTTKLPSSKDLTTPRILMTSANDLHVFGSLPSPEGDDSDHGRPYLAHYDGKAWTEQAVPECAGGAAAFAPFEDGEAWLLCSPEDPWFGGGLEGLDGSGTVWHREAETWTRVPLPDSAQGMQLVATAPDEVWVATDRGVYYSKRPAKVLELPSQAELLFQRRELDPAVPLLSCEWGTTLLEPEPAGDHPEMVAALEAIGKEFGEDTGNLALVEVDFQGKPHLALQTGFEGVPAKVVRAVEQALGDDLGETRCVHREPRRVLWSIEP